MPLLYDIAKQINKRIAIWHVEETIEALKSLLDCSVPSDILKTHELHQKQRLASRLLLKRINNNVCPDVSYNSFKKPHLLNKQAYISISHTQQLVAVIQSTTETGIDIEQIQPKVERVAKRFLSDAELADINGENRLAKLTTYWCAKEALYKYYGKKELDYRKHILIQPFEWNEKGMIRAAISTKEMNIQLNLCYEKIMDCMLVYVDD